MKAILQAARDGGVPEEHVSWAERVLSSRNDLPLRTVIKMLIDDAGAPGKYLMARVPDADKRIASARTAHGGMKSSGVEQFWLGTVLAFLLRLHLLREIGVDPRTIERRVLAARMFRRAVAALSKSATASD